EAGDVEIAVAVVAVARQRRMLPEDRGWARVVERVAVAHALADLADDPPVRLGLAGRGHEGALARDAALGVGDRAVLLAPGGGRQQHGRERRGVGAPHAI